MDRPPRALATMTWTDVGARVGPARSLRFVVVPIGSCEQHGPHLPMHTDTVIATALAERLAELRSDCIVTPAVAITASGEHRGFPGTLSIGTEIMAGLVIELARSADWADGVVFVNGHGGNSMAMRRAEEVFEHERRSVLIWWPSTPGGDPHAGHTETSLMLALSPDEVRLADALTGPIPTMADLVNHGVRPLSETGVLGDPTTATVDDGRRIFGLLVDQLTSAVAQWVDRLDGSEDR